MAKTTGYYFRIKSESEDDKADDVDEKSEMKEEEEKMETDSIEEPPAKLAEDCAQSSASGIDDENRGVEKTDEKVDKVAVDGATVEKEDMTNGVSENGVVSEVNGSSDKDAEISEVATDVKVNGKSDSESMHSEDSEKENMVVDTPIDLSTKPMTPNGKESEVLSEEDDEDPKRFSGKHELSLQDLKLKRKMIKKLQAELRNEEAKLVLLKKLRYSQMSHQVNDVSRKTPQGQQGSAQPPPLVRGSQVPNQPPAKAAHTQPQPPPRGNAVPQTKSQGGPPPLVMAPKQLDQRQLMEKQMKMLQEQQLLQRAGATSQQAASLAGFRGTQAQADALRQFQQAQQRVVEETPAERQAKAKLALRKQLEKTLLQIPPPKPPPPEMNFIPSLASPDFIYLLGLEEAVNYIIDVNLISKGKKNPDEKMVCNPFTCVQCGTDFTPVWKREKPGSKNVICEQCVTSNQKKALKQEHTNRLKSAFVKALQQEQEIERMQSLEMKSGTLSTSSSSSSLKEKPVERERESRENSAARNAAAAAQAYKESIGMAESLRQQHQNLVQAHQAAALRMGQPLGLQFNPRAPFPYQLPFARANELQRQYLLEMIPKGGLPWNS